MVFDYYRSFLPGTCEVFLISEVEASGLLHSTVSRDSYEKSSKARLQAVHS